MLVSHIFNLMRLFRKALCGKIGHCSVQFHPGHHLKRTPQTNRLHLYSLSRSVTPRSISLKTKSPHSSCFKHFFKKFHCWMLFRGSPLPLGQCQAVFTKPHETWAPLSSASCLPTELNSWQPPGSLLPLRPATALSSILGTDVSSLWLASRDIFLLRPRSG